MKKDKREKMKETKNNNYIWKAGLLILLFIISFLYLMFPLIIQPDSIDYYKYLDIFNGIKPISSWNVVRGPSLPSILFLITKIFGNNTRGILIGSYLFFMLFILVYLMFILKTLKNSSRLRKIIVIIMTILFILFNPVLYGYFRTLMTEFVAIPLVLITCLLANKWIKSDNFLKYTFIFSLIAIFFWFLKQQYLIIAISALLVSLFISCFLQNKKIIIKKIATIFIVLITVVTSITIWKNFLVHNGVNYDNSPNSSLYLNKAIILGNTNIRMNYEKSSLTIDDIKNDIYLSDIDKEKIINIINGKSKQNFEMLSIFEPNGVLKTKEIIYYDSPRYSILDATKFFFKMIVQEPIISFDAYVANYLATINLFTSVRDGYGEYHPDHRFVNYNHENYFAALQHLRSKDNFLWMREDIIEPVQHLQVKNNVSTDLKNAIEKISFIGLDSFKLLFVLLPFLFIYSLIKNIKNIKNKRILKEDNIITILLGSSLIYMLFLSFTGAIIDRYAYVVYPEVVLAISCMILQRKDKISVKNKSSIFNKNGKLIFVIPAYNEEKNIEKVINDIHKNMPKADIVVTNDYSKDNTRKIVEKLNVPCLNVPFNLGYAMAVQTGIKYAYKNDYDYVILFDADGQHLASEAKKLVNKMKETNANIIIGSRFIEKTDYKHPFFRKIGTKMFQLIIRIFCKKNITDPTSGFQLLDKSVIERYAKIGKYPEFPDANLIIEMLLNGYEIEEVSVKMKLNDTGQSMHSGIIKPIKYMINVTYSIIFILIKGKSNREE